MKILYAIQGTGNGHISRARDIIPILNDLSDLDVLVSGVQADVTLNNPVKYKCRGLSFIFGKKGGVDLYKTFLNANSKSLYKEIKNLPVEDYDLIINDFEPVSSWAAHLKEVPCVALSHQSALLNKKVPRPDKKDNLGWLILKNYAPTTRQYGFHFKEYDKNIYTPIIRQQIREQIPVDKGHITVYLPSYSDKKIISVLGTFKNIDWQVFSKHTKKSFSSENVTILPINNQNFVKSMVTSHGVLCGAGFETPAEALFLNKKLIVIPMKNQYEQQFNAKALEEMNIPVLKSLKSKHNEKILNWLETDTIIEVDYQDKTKEIIENLIEVELGAGIK